MSKNIRIRDSDWSANLWSRVRALFSGLDTRVTALEQGGGGGAGAGDENVIEAISFNGSNVAPDADKRVSLAETDPTVPAWAKAATKPAYTAAEVGAIPTTQKGASGGVAELDSGGRVPISQLPYLIDSSSNWAAKTSFVPDRGTIIVYTDKEQITENGITKNVAGIKIGDGNAYVVDLPFITQTVENDLNDHVQNTVVHITDQERLFWNNKLNCTINDETVIFNRN